MNLQPFRTPAAYDAGFLGPLSEAVRAMEYRGVPVDLDRAAELESQFRKELDVTRQGLTEWAEAIHVPPMWNSKTRRDEFPPNWNSHDQLVRVLHGDVLGLPPSPYMKKGAVPEGKVSTDDRALEWVSAANPEHRDGINLVRKLRKQERMLGYLVDWRELAVKHEDGWRLHPSYGLSSDFDDRPGAVTGRFGVKNPPLQQVPSRGEYGALLRSVFRAPPGKRLIVADYSQLEVVILAHICFMLFGATGLLHRLDRGVPDIHSATAKYVFGTVLGDEVARAADLSEFKKKGTHPAHLRDLVKAIRYGLNYGKGAQGFGVTLFTPSGDPIGAERSQEMIDALLDMDPEIREYQDFTRRFIEEFHGYHSLLGRWLPLPLATSWKRGERNRAWRRALNYPMQAGGQEVTGSAMIVAHRDEVLRQLGAEMLLQVHDELIFWVPEDNADKATARVTEDMETALPLQAVLQAPAHHADRWNEAK